MAFLLQHKSKASTKKKKPAQKRFMRPRILISMLAMVVFAASLVLQTFLWQQVQTTWDGSSKGGLTHEKVFWADVNSAGKEKGKLNWMDAMVESNLQVLEGPNFQPTLSRGDLPLPKTVFPLGFHLSTSRRLLAATCASPEIMHATWTSGEGRSRTVDGNWPDRIQEFVFLGIRKNAHTHILNTIGDLPRWLGPSAQSYLPKSVKDNRPVMEGIFERQEENRKHPSSAKMKPPLVFAVLRDPVDRFLSATCQDMTKMHRTTISRMCEGDILDPLVLVDCFLARMQNPGTFECHQTPQVLQIINGISKRNISVSILMQDEALSDLIEELGGEPLVKNRDRTKEKVYLKFPFLQRFCQTRPSDLKPEQKAKICQVYQDDIKLLEMAGHPVDYC